MAEAIREISGMHAGSLDGEILASTEPIVLRGLVAAWPLVNLARARQAGDRRAAAAYLLRFYRGAPVVALLGAPEIAGRYFYNDDLTGFNFSSLRATLAKVLEELDDHRDDAAPPAIYVGSTMIDQCLPGFQAENTLDLGGRDALASIWIGNRSRIAAHYDLPDNLACVAAGRRRFTLFPPDQLANLYVGPLDFTPAGQPISLVDLHQPDLKAHPGFSEALRHAQVAELGPGDALFIPSMWWHHVEALDSFNILVNYWWRQSPGYMDTPTNTLLHALLSMRELPPEQRAAWRELFRHYVFDSDGSEAAHIPPGARGVLAPFDADAARRLRVQLLNKMNR